MNRLIFLILVCLLISACSSRVYLDTDFSNSRYKNEKDEKAVVFLKTNVTFETKRFFSKSIKKDWVLTEWLHLNSNKFFSNINTSFLDSFLGVPEYRVFFLEPGLYDLSDIYFHTQDYEYRNKKPLRNIALFSVAAGDVVYLGDIMFEIPKSKKILDGLNIQDNYEVVSQYVKEKYPELYLKLKRKMIILPNNHIQHKTLRR